MFTEGYIGITVKLPKYRFSEHKIKANTESSLPISRAIRKYGDEIIIDTLIIGSQEYCRNIEAMLRPNPKIGWNLAIGGQASGTTGRHHTEETKAKLSNILSGRKVSQEIKDKISLGQIGRKQSEATKAKIAAARKGKKHSDATRAKMSASRQN